MAAPVFGLVDKLALGADWELQSQAPSTGATRVTASGGNGDIVAEVTHNSITSGTSSYIYVGVLTGFAAALAAASADVGDVMASLYLITGVAVDYSPCAAGKRPVVTFTWRTGPTTARATYVTALTLPTYVAITPVVPTILTVTAGDAEAQSASWSLTAQYGEDLDTDGEYLAGETYQGEETINLSFVGIPTSITSTGYKETTAPATSESNTAYATHSYTFVTGVTRA